MAFVERDAAEQLNIEMTHLESAPARLAHHRERFGEDRFERLSATDPGAKSLGSCAKLFVGERGERRFQRVDTLDGAMHPSQLPVIASPDDLVEQRLDHHAPGRLCNDFAMSGISI